MFFQSAIFNTLHVTLNRSSWNSVLHCIKNISEYTQHWHKCGLWNTVLHLPCNTGPLSLCPTYTDPFLCMTGYKMIKRTEVNLGRVKKWRKVINFSFNNIHFYQHNILSESMYQVAICYNITQPPTFYYLPSTSLSYTSDSSWKKSHCDQY